MAGSVRSFNTYTRPRALFNLRSSRQFSISSSRPKSPRPHGALLALFSLMTFVAALVSSRLGSCSLPRRSRVRQADKGRFIFIKGHQCPLLWSPHRRSQDHTRLVRASFAFTCASRLAADTSPLILRDTLAKDHRMPLLNSLLDWTVQSAARPGNAFVIRKLFVAVG